MTSQIPIGQRESQRLEFKSAEALRHLASIGREVVAMMNTEGGDVWIGLREADGIAVTVEPVQNPDHEVGRLQDYFSDSIEPAPGPREIMYEQIHDAGGGVLLRLRIQPVSESGPRALREKAARLFVRRVGDRIRPMSHEEIATKFSPTRSTNDPVAKAGRKMLEARDFWLGKGKILWLRIQSIHDLDFRFRSEGDFRKYFADPAATGNRSAGWNFVNPYESVRRESGAIVHGSDEAHWVRLYRDGGIEFTMPIENLYWKSVSGRSEVRAKEIWPYSLLEYPISVFRLARAIYNDHARNKLGPVLGDMALFGLQGWTLRPYSPRSFGYRLSTQEPYREENLLFQKPLTYTPDEILEEPDRCGFRLVDQVYDRFGYWEKEIPQELNQESGRLVIPNE